jgi:hypothetical protein
VATGAGSAWAGAQRCWHSSALAKIAMFFSVWGNYFDLVSLKFMGMTIKFIIIYWLKKNLRIRCTYSHKSSVVCE